MDTLSFLWKEVPRRGGGWMAKAVSPTHSLPRVGKAKRRRLRRKKGSQPRLAVLGSPFQRKGLAWSFPPSIGRRCPEGAEVGWGKRYEKERERSSQVRRLREHPIHRCAVPLPQWGRLRYGDTAFLAPSKRIHAYVEKKNNDGQSLPLEGKVASGASRIGY